MNTATIRASACQKRRELAEQFATSTRLYSETVVMLTQSVAEKFEGLLSDSAQARTHMEDARVAFEEHIREHGC
jgi:hypothetical protein